MAQMGTNQFNDVLICFKYISALVQSFRYWAVIILPASCILSLQIDECENVKGQRIKIILNHILNEFGGNFCCLRVFSIMYSHPFYTNTFRNYYLITNFLLTTKVDRSDN